MATRNQKIPIEILLAGAEIGGIKLQPHLVKTVAQGVLDVTEDMLPEAGKSVTVEVPLHRQKFAKTVGRVKLEIRA